MCTLLEATANMDSFLVANSNRVKIAANQRGLLSAQDAADYLSISERSFHRLVASGHIRRRRIGATVRFSVSDLNEFIEQLPDDANSVPWQKEIG
jgi:excisionase family DNA binding protein